MTELKGIGLALAEKLARLNLHTLTDLLFHLPHRYEDRTRITPLNLIQPGLESVVEGEVLDLKVVTGRRRSLRCHITDGKGYLTLRFFHFSSHQQKLLNNCSRVRCYGEIRRGADGLEMYHPEYQTLVEGQTLPLAGTLTPVYPSTEGITQKRLRGLVAQALSSLITDTGLPDLLSGLAQVPAISISLAEAIHILHNPPVDTSLALLSSGQHPAQQRLAFEELLAHHLSLLLARISIRKNQAPAILKSERLLADFRAQLSFELTTAQNRVLDEISADLTKTSPMLRLLQGDVGCGKTIIAAMATLMAANSHVQTALMAPTELLAEQHLSSFTTWFGKEAINIAWLSGKLKGKKRGEELDKISSNNAQLVIGTHAIFQDDVQFSNLGLIIVDEQHKFGVQQRLALRDKAIHSGFYPHQLVMTATPIPRTLTMSVYADLDCSVIDELPPGRIPVQTAVISDERRAEVIERVQAACSDGRQVYWVCTLIEDSDILTCQAAESTALELAQLLPHLQIGLIHGRLSAADKRSVMDDFESGRISLLVATTVIEVGVDVPGASLMIIENPERLGLAQLHQLRGRVGRGNQASHCLLMYHSPLGDASRQRLNIMRSTNDGFRIAEEDLKIRGPGEVLGTRQTGDVSFRIADLLRDERFLPQVKKTAQDLLENHPDRIQPIIDRWLPNTAYSQV